MEVGSSYCTGPEVVTLRLIWTNHSNAWSNATLFEAFLCRLAGYASMKRLCHLAEAYAVFVFGLFGLLGAASSVIVFSWRPFRKLDFSLYRLIGILEIVHTSIMVIVRQIQLVGNCERSYVCVFFRAHVHLAITNTCAETVDAIVLFVTVERIVACLLPKHFRRIHAELVYDSVMITSLTVSTFFNVIQAFDVEVVQDASTEDEVFAHVPSPFADSSFYVFMSKVNLLRTCFVGAALALATCFSVVGLVKTEIRKRHLLRLQENQQNTSNRLKYNQKNLKRTIDLCCLQLCSAIPILINHVVYAMTLRDGPTTTDVNKIAHNAFRSPGSEGYTTAVVLVDRARNRQYLRLATNLSNILAHSAHFYLYLLFCGKIRAATWNLVAAIRELCGRLFMKTHGVESGSRGTVTSGSRSAVMCTSF